MSTYRLERYASGDGDPIDTSDANAILEKIKKLEEENLELKKEIKILKEAFNISNYKVNF